MDRTEWKRNTEELFRSKKSIIYRKLLEQRNGSALSALQGTNYSQNDRRK